VAGAIGVGIAIPPVASFSDVNIALGTVTSQLQSIKSTATTSLANLSGTSGGSIAYAMPLTGATLKVFIAYVDLYKNSTATAQQIIFSTAFSHTPILLHDDTGGATITAFQITLPVNMVSTATGWIIVIGF